MARKKKPGPSGKKGGKVVDEPLDASVRKGKPKRQKKQSKGKKKR